jgi:hypothetical protein
MNNISLIAPSRSGHNWTATVIRSWFEDDTKVRQFEAVNPVDFPAAFERRLRWNPVNPADPVHNVLQVRDYLNWAASWTKYNLRSGHAYRKQKVVQLFDNWLAITKEAFNETSYLGNKVVLLYDHFAQNEAYRKSVCLLLDGDYNEEMINFVPKGGMGSSFDSYNKQGNGSEMDVLSRWKWFLTEEGSEYIDYLKVKKNILEYYVDKFDLSSGQSNLVNEILR